MATKEDTIVCETCRGFGVVKDNQASGTCPTCHGHGLTRLLDQYRLVAHLPAQIAYGRTERELAWLKFRPLILIASVLITVVLAFTIAQTPLVTSTGSLTGSTLTGTVHPNPRFNIATLNDNLINRFTEPQDFIHLIFWMLILLDLYWWFRRVHDLEPPHKLNDLRETSEHKKRQLHTETDGSIDVIPYFTQGALRAIDEAVILAEKVKSAELTPHIWLASLLCSGKTGVIISRLEQDAKNSCVTAVKKITTGQRGVKDVVITPAARTLILEAFVEAWQNGFNVVDEEDLLLALLKNPGELEPDLKELKLEYEPVRSVALWFNEELESLRQWQFWRQKGRTRPKGYMNKAWTARPTPFLDRYSRDFTKLASLGELPIVKVRNREIDEVIRILASGSKNNALVVGEPGVGKTSIIGAVAARMVEENIPEPLKDKRLVELDLSALVSGGRTEKENIDQVLQDVKAAGNIILYIGHIEALVNKSGGLSGASLLEAASKSASLQIIGTATFADYHRYVESNPSFANSFQKVVIEEVNDADAITIIEEESPLIQGKYKVLLTYPAIKTAVELSRKLIPDKVLPDKALEVLSDAAQRAGAKKQHYVTKDIVQAVLSERSNVPVTDLTQTDRDRLLNLDEEMKKRVIGQDEAVTKIAEALQRARAGLKDEQRPIGSFLFVGPTGVGKTEAARTLAGTYFGSRDNMIRIDMSEYQDNKAIYRLIGAPASSAEEFTDGGALTQAVREKPYSIILLDEIEKGHPDVLNLFLQLLDDGRLTENTGRTVSFANTIVIATSNAGASEIATAITAGKPEAEVSQVAMQRLTAVFKPEFVNRFDAVVVFKPLTADSVQTIATIMLAEVAAKLLEQGIKATFANDVIAYVSKVGFDPKFGARPLRRAIQDHVETKLADRLLRQQIDKSQPLLITAAMLGLTV